MRRLVFLFHSTSNCYSTFAEVFGHFETASFPSFVSPTPTPFDFHSSFPDGGTREPGGYTFLFAVRLSHLQQQRSRRASLGYTIHCRTTSRSLAPTHTRLPSALPSPQTTLLGIGSSIVRRVRGRGSFTRDEWADGSSIHGNGEANLERARVWTAAVRAVLEPYIRLHDAAIRVPAIVARIVGLFFLPTGAGNDEMEGDFSSQCPLRWPILHGRIKGVSARADADLEISLQWNVREHVGISHKNQV